MNMSTGDHSLKNIKYLLLLMLFPLFLASYSRAQEINFRGQASAWAVTNPAQATQVGLRYIPELQAGIYQENYFIDTDISLNMYGTSEFWHKRDSVETLHDLKAYRLWLRFSTSQFEIRAGLQKINFGSANLLRALMWFDSIDPRDPLQLTDGVYAILTRYYFLNNANIWFWILYGNDRTRGWEVFVSDQKKPEFGGRLQVPLFSGEMAFTYHHRDIDAGKSLAAPYLFTDLRVPENRIAIDGKWDVEAGVWMEAVLIYRDLPYKDFNYQQQTNLGIDYTFDLGNGLHAIAEHFNLRFSDKAFGDGEGISMTAFSLDYPLGLLDDFTAMVYYEWDQKNWYRFLRWQRTYDNWIFYLMAFWNPEQYQLYQLTNQENLYAGKGLQLLVVFNH
jgi:hypothetical protein